MSFRNPVTTLPASAITGSLPADQVGSGNFTGNYNIVGAFTTGGVGARVDINSTGIYAYNSGGSQTVKISAGDGSVSISGTFTIATAPSGTRMVIDNTGINAYNGATNTFNLNAATGSVAITGSFKTGTTGARIEMVNNGITVYNAAGEGAFIDAVTAGGLPVMELLSPANASHTEKGTLLLLGNIAGASEVRANSFLSAYNGLTVVNGSLTVSSGFVAASALAGSLLSAANPLRFGTASPGTSTIPARDDHVHPSTTMGYAEFTATDYSTSATAATVTFTAVSGRRYRIAVEIGGTQVTATGVVTANVNVDGVTKSRPINSVSLNTSTNYYAANHLVLVGDGASHTVTVTIADTAGAFRIPASSNATSQNFILVEDVGT